MWISYFIIVVEKLRETRVNFGILVRAFDVRPRAAAVLDAPAGQVNWASERLQKE